MTKKKTKAQKNDEQDKSEASEDAVVDKASATAESELMPASADSEKSSESQASENSESEDDQLVLLQAEVEENLDKYLRAKAETENVRRRSETEVANARKFAIEKFATEILTIRDSLEMARTMDLQAGGQDVLEKIHEGMDLTLKQFDATFEKFQMEMVSPEGEKFNPDLHQAISMIDSPEVAANHVVSVVQKGCTISERLLRPALVIVSKGKGEQENNKKDENDEESTKNEANSS